jgi:hypothetical protein
MMPTRPSIMSEGARMSQPARVWTSACSTSRAMVGSLAMSPFSIIPSWPWSVKGSSATSHMMPTSGAASFMARTARQMTPFGSAASEPAASFRAPSM